MERIELKTYPNPCLRVKTKPVEVFDEELSNTVRRMADLMREAGGIGLAATQVGIGLSVITIDAGSGLLVMINPSIEEKSKKKNSFEEGCLSLPGLTVLVARPESVKVRAQNERGEFFIKKYDGLDAKVVQHEIDHLNGRMIIDYLGAMKKIIVMRDFASKRKTAKKTCEVTCDVGTKIK